jgi:hypothetical protein
MNTHMRGAAVASALVALASPLYVGLPTSTPAFAAQAAGSTTTAIVVPATQIDAFGYSGPIPTFTSDTGSLVASSPLVHWVTKPAASENLANASGLDTARAAGVSWTPSIRALGFMSPDDLENKSLRSLYQIERLTTLAQPHLDVTLFGGGLVSEDYYLTDEGIQLEQSITEGLGIVGRVTGYQLWIEKASSSPLSPSNHTVNRLNFGRFQGGFDLSPLPGFNFVFLGGHDVGDSDAWTIESDISMWFMQGGDHPINVFVAPVHNFQNDVTSSEIDFRVVATQTPNWTLLLGAGGQVFGGGFISGIAGEGGPIVGIYNRIYQMGADLQFGYGSPGFYGELTIYKTLSIPGL